MHPSESGKSSSVKMPYLISKPCYYTSSVSLYLLHLTFYAIQCDILIIYTLNYTYLKIIRSLYYESIELDDSN